MKFPMFLDQFIDLLKHIGKLSYYLKLKHDLFKYEKIQFLLKYWYK